jgi:hypothetical protein
MMRFVKPALASFNTFFTRTSSGTIRLMPKRSKPTNAPALGERAMVLVVVDAVRMTDEQPLRRDALPRHQVDLLVSAGRLLGVRNQRHAGLPGGARAGLHELLLVVRDPVAPVAIFTAPREYPSRPPLR